MDTSEKYIEMCKKAHEIQIIRVPLWGFCKFETCDTFVRKNLTYIYANPEVDQPRTEDTIWLPRQDQLQELVEFSKESIAGTALNPMDGYLSGFTGWVRASGGVNLFYQYKYKEQFQTMEQLWLVFVMKMVYDKLWNTETKEWYKIK